MVHSVQLRKLVCERCPLPCTNYLKENIYSYCPQRESKIPSDYKNKPALLHQVCKHYSPVERMRLELML